MMKHFIILSLGLLMSIFMTMLISINLQNSPGFIWDTPVTNFLVFVFCFCFVFVYSCLYWITSKV